MEEGSAEKTKPLKRKKEEGKAGKGETKSLPTTVERCGRQDTCFGREIWELEKLLYDPDIYKIPIICWKYSSNTIRKTYPDAAHEEWLELQDSSRKHPNRYDKPVRYYTLIFSW